MSGSDEELVHFRPEQDFRDAIARLFAKVQSELQALCPTADIQHVGSTSIPGSLTKGDLDIQVRVNRSEYQAVKEKLSRLYTVNVGGFASDDAVSFENYSVQPSLGIHVTVIGGSADIQWKFRDLLATSRALREQYDALKRRFEGGAMERYRDAKSDFISRALHDQLLIPVTSVKAPER